MKEVFRRQLIVEEIRRVTQENGGRAPGKARFYQLTGIRESDWLGRFWARWSDALAEAGEAPNTMQERIPDDVLLEMLAGEVRRLQRFPTIAELKLRRRDDPTFPSSAVFSRWGGQRQLVRQLIEFCERSPQQADLLPILSQLPLGEEADRQPSSRPQAILGYVYLIRAGRYYKIGRTNADGRRLRELSIQLPERAQRVHVIKTDDPVGIELYWHRRFAGRRVRPDAEWFDLTPEEVAAFRMRRFM